MESICRKRWWYLQLSCILMVNLVYGNLEYKKEVPASLGEIDDQCLESSARRLVDMKKLRLASTVLDLWEFLIFLKTSSIPKHNEIFETLAQTFWDMYIDCVVSRSHGMGRRQLAPEHFLTYSQKTSEGFANLNSRAKRQVYRRYLRKVTSA